MMARLRQQLRDEDGFTLVELLVVMLLLGIVGSAIVASSVQAMGVTRRGQERVYGIGEMQRTVENVTREIRAAVRVGVAQNSVIEVDVLRDGRGHRYRYELTAAGSLTGSRQVYTDDTFTTTLASGSYTARTLVPDVPPGGVTFEYRNRHGDVLPGPVSAANLRQIRSVAVTVTRRLPEQNPIVIETSVYLRNSNT